MIDLAKIVGSKPVYLKFWATWCVPCRQQMPAFERDYQTLRDKVQVVAVNTGFNDDLIAVRRYRGERHLTMPIVIDDGSLGAALHLRVTPQHVVIGRGGKVNYVGHLEDAALHRALAAAAAPAPGMAGGATTVASGPIENASRNVTAAAAAPFRLTGPIAGKRIRAIFFFSPWCETYLAQSRPSDAKACRAARIAVTRLADDERFEWLGVASGLWATPRDIEEYRHKTGLTMPAVLDTGHQLFRQFDVRTVPTVVLINRQGKVIDKIVKDTRPILLSSSVEQRPVRVGG